MSYDARIGSPRAYEPSAPDGVTRITRFGEGPEAVGPARAEPPRWGRRQKTGAPPHPGVSFVACHRLRVRHA